MTAMRPLADYSGKHRPMQDGDMLPASILPPAQGTSVVVSKAAHGFVVGEPVRLDIDSLGAQTWSAAYATADLTHTATHYVVAVVDVNTFRAANSGYWPIIPASPVYGLQILGPTAGSVVASVIDLPHEVGIQPLGMLDATGLHINILSYVRDLTP